jgi:hypothetical protein
MARKAPVRTEPHPTFPRGLAYEVTPMELADQSTQEFMGGHATRQDHAESPGSDGASLYLPALPRL